MALCFPGGTDGDLVLDGTGMARLDPRGTRKRAFQELLRRFFPALSCDATFPSRLLKTIGNQEFRLNSIQEARYFLPVNAVQDPQVFRRFTAALQRTPSVAFFEAGLDGL